MREAEIVKSSAALCLKSPTFFILFNLNPVLTIYYPLVLSSYQFSCLLYLMHSESIMAYYNNQHFTGTASDSGVKGVPVSHFVQEHWQLCARKIYLQKHAARLSRTLFLVTQDNLYNLIKPFKFKFSNILSYLHFQCQWTVMFHDADVEL